MNKEETVISLLKEIRDLLKKKATGFLVCSECEKSDATVKERECGYSKEIHNMSDIEVICDDCEHEHLMNI